jgi:hypothetical protein
MVQVGKGKQAMKKSRLPVGYFLWAGLLLVSVPAWGTEWKLCAENEFLSLYFDAARLSRGENDTVKVWVRYVPKGKKGREFWAHIRNLDQVPLKQFQHYGSSVVLYELHCSDQVYRLVSGIDYDRENRMVAEMGLSSWKPIYPDSLIETLLPALCRN